MTWGAQTPEADAHRQLDLALEAGIEFVDTAEMYPVNPVRRETVGRTEEILGRALAARPGARARLVVATKVAGPRSAAREGGFDPPTLRAACEASLRRLGVEAVGLYQLHWPERPHWHFRRNWTFDPSGQDRAAVLGRMDEVLGALGELMREGKIRALGLSNETAWGIARWTDRAAAAGLRFDTVQNEHSLMCRLGDTDVAEALAMEGMTLLAFSPLAAGLLTGKYQGGARPPGSRLAAGDGALGGRLTPRALAAEAAYRAVAAEAGLDPLQMALAWHRSLPVTSLPLLGATTADQLARQLGGRELRLAPELVARLDAVHRDHPLPF
jgi:aryl-alcohol dehydrogenase-like predicted oxidoreductase